MASDYRLKASHNVSALQLDRQVAYKNTLPTTPESPTMVYGDLNGAADYSDPAAKTFIILDNGDAVHVADTDYIVDFAGAINVIDAASFEADYELVT